MADHPIIMSAESVCGILAKRTTQTRRVMRVQPVGHRTGWSQSLEPGDVYIELDGSVTRAVVSRGRNKRDAGELTPQKVRCPYGQSGDALWVREQWAAHPMLNDCRPSDIGPGHRIWFAADENKPAGSRWRPSIHMPKWAARLWLEVREVRVEQIQDISFEDIEDEGVPIEDTGPSGEKGILAYRDFRQLWDSLNAKRGHPWSNNDGVWAITFKLLETRSDTTQS